MIENIGKSGLNINRTTEDIGWKRNANAADTVRTASKYRQQSSHHRKRTKVVKYYNQTHFFAKLLWSNFCAYLKKKKLNFEEYFFCTVLRWHSKHGLERRKICSNAAHDWAGVWELKLFSVILDFFRDETYSKINRENTSTRRSTRDPLPMDPRRKNTYVEPGVYETIGENFEENDRCEEVAF